jgi:putative flippase GtrA
MMFPHRLKHITDPMSGLFLVRRDALHLDSFDPIGFKILLEIAVRLAPLEVREVPFVFEARHAGESKTSLKEGLRFVRHLLRLKTSTASTWLRMLEVGTVGVTGIAVNTLALWFFHAYVGVAVVLAALLATQVSTTWNFVLTDRVVYRGRRRRWGRSFLIYAVVNNLILIGRLPLMWLFIRALTQDYRVANVATLVLAFAARFAVVDRAIYRGDDLHARGVDNHGAQAALVGLPVLDPGAAPHRLAAQPAGTGVLPRAGRARAQRHRDQGR